jgi:hypothetical protein
VVEREGKKRMNWVLLGVLGVAGFSVGWIVGQVVLMLRDDGRYDLWLDEDE